MKRLFSGLVRLYCTFAARFGSTANTNLIPACCCEAWAMKRGEIRAFFAVLYLFGSNRGLLKRAWNACLPSGFEPGYMVMRRVSAHDYTLIKAAKAITGFSSGLELEDLADAEIVDDAAFRLIVNALLIANYGSDVLKLGGTEITY